MIVNPILQKLHVLGFTQVQRPVDSPRVAGRIFRFATKWKVITEDQWILHTVQGFHIRTLPNAPSSTLSLCGGADSPQDGKSNEAGHKPESPQLYFVRFVACNTGISFLFAQHTAI